jgi:hypothetical protein
MNIDWITREVNQMGIVGAPQNPEAQIHIFPGKIFLGSNEDNKG